MRIVVTRPEPDASALAARLRAAGSEPILAPLLEIVHRPAPELPLEKPQAIVATSRHAIAALHDQRRADAWRDLPIFVVGGATADAARADGWRMVLQSSESAAGLIEQIERDCRPSGGSLFYARGVDITLDLRAILAMKGFSINEPVLYAAQAVPALPASLATALDALATSDRADATILMSRRTAEVFVHLCDASGRRAVAGTLIHYCLSPAVAAPLAEWATPIVRIAEKPDLEHILALVNRDDAQFRLERTPR